MIGILLALQVNNWNEGKKIAAKVDTLILALRDDLVQDTLLIIENLPEVNHQLQFNESLRARIAAPYATVDTLLQIVRHEFNPNWNNSIIYNTNAYNSLNDSELMEELPGDLKTLIKNFYNQKFYLQGMVDRVTVDYRAKVSSYVDTYTFGSTELHDQGHLIDSLVWSNIDLGDVAAKFQGISNFKRIVFRLTKEDLEYSLQHSRTLIGHIDDYVGRQK